MIIGGTIGNYYDATVLKFDSNNINNAPMEVEKLRYARHSHACTIFNSALHDGRPLAIVAGGYSSHGGKKAEIWDFTKDSTSWQQSNIILFTYYLLLLFCLKEGVISVSDLSYVSMT